MPQTYRDTWTAAYVADLPDSAFLYIAPGGQRGSDGRTSPRSKRYFPVRDRDGLVDELHLRNAVDRIPLTLSLSPDARATALSAARRITFSEQRSMAAPVVERLPDDALGEQERTFSLVMELRSSGDGRTLMGRAVPYGVAADVGSFRERFVPGVFARQVGAGQLAQVKLYDMHRDRIDGAHPIGRTISMSERPDGLYGEWGLFDTSRAEDALKLVRANEVTGLSVGFTSKPAGSRRGSDGVIERHVAHLDHVALTHEPVYAEAQVLAVRSKLPQLDAERDRYRELVRR
jgi:hypothetical protein